MTLEEFLIISHTVAITKKAVLTNTYPVWTPSTLHKVFDGRGEATVSYYSTNKYIVAHLTRQGSAMFTKSIKLNKQKIEECAVSTAFE